MRSSFARTIRIMTPTMPTKFNLVLSVSLFGIPLIGGVIVLILLFLNSNEDYGIATIILNPIVAPILAAALLSLPCLIVTFLRGVFLPNSVCWIDCVSFTYQSALWIPVIWFATRI